MLQEPVHFVGEQMAPCSSASDQSREGPVVAVGAGWVVGKVDDDDARVGPHARATASTSSDQSRGCERNERDFGADVPCHFMQRLIRRPHDDGVIAA